MSRNATRNVGAGGQSCPLEVIARCRGAPRTRGDVISTGVARFVNPLVRGGLLTLCIVGDQRGIPRVTRIESCRGLVYAP